MAPALETVVKQLTDSGIIAPGKLENFVPPKAHPQSVEELVAELVKHKELTPFQAAQVKSGKVRALILGEYTLLDRIGAGGMGQVFKAVHRRMDRTVAIKMLPPAMTKDAAAIARFEREVRAAAKLRHPNIVAADDAGQAGAAHFLVMEYVDGKDLSALVKKDGPLPVNKAVNYILQAARGLEFAHGEGVVHRDIKPANLLLDKKGTVKILDMGLARIEQADGAHSDLTGSGTIMGTVDYMAPEQGMSTKHADARADIYSLGCSLYYLLAGKAMYGGETMAAKLVAHHTHPTPDLRAECPQASRELTAIFAKMVAKKLEDRYQTMTEVIADLERCQADLTSPSSTATVKTSPSSATQDSEMTVAFGSRLLQSAPHPEAHQKPGRSGPPRRNIKLLAGAGAAGFLLFLLGVIVIFRNQKGEEVGRMELPDGTSVEVQASGKVDPSEKSVDLLKLVDPGVSFNGDAWKLGADGLRSPDRHSGWALVKVPYQPPDEYDWDVMAEKLGGGQALTLHFVTAGHQGTVCLDGYSPTACALEMIDGQFGPKRVGSIFKPGAVARIRVSVRKSGVTVLCDGQTILSWQGDMAKFSTFGGWKVPDKRSLYVGSQTAYRIREMTLTPR